MKLNMLLNLPLGANTAPIGLNKKEIWPAIIAAVAAIAGAGIAASSSSSANAANRAIANDTNEANKAINDSQLEYARDQYNRERLENRYLVDQSWQREIENRTHQEQYNSPAAQAARLRAAGINPALAMSSGSSLGILQSSVKTSEGQQAKGNQPNAIPMQSGNPLESIFKSGFGLSEASQIYLNERSQINAEKKTDFDISAKEAEIQQNFLNYLLEQKKVHKNDQFIDARIHEVYERLKLAKNEFEHRQAIDNAQIKINEYNARTERFKASIQEQLADSQVQLDNATIANLAAQASATYAEVEEMKLNGASQRRINTYIAKREKESAKIAEINRKDMDFSGNKSVEKHVRAYKKAVDIVFAPIKGLINVGIK